MVVATAVGREATTVWRPPRELTEGQWVRHGQRLGLVSRSAGWWIGDWLLYGNRRYGERYARAARITGYDTQTLMNMVYVASRFEPRRRRPRLSWSHHAELAALPRETQDKYLDLSEERRLSVRCLRLELRGRRSEPSHPEHAVSESAPSPSAERLCPACGAPVIPAVTNETAL